MDLKRFLTIVIQWNYYGVFFYKGELLWDENDPAKQQ